MPAQRVRIALWCGLGAAAIGGLALLGWLLDVSALRSPLPGQVDMKANTALGLLAGGVSLHLLARGRRRDLAFGLAAFMALIGAAVGIEYLAGVDLGIDELLFQDHAGGQTVHPGRLAPQTAGAFVLLGVALMGIATRRLGAGLSECFSLIVAVTTLSAVIGYAYGGGALTGIPALTPIAFVTAVALLILSIGVAALRPHPAGLVSALAGEGLGGIASRRLLGGAILLIPFVGWLRLQGELRGYYGIESGVALYSVAFIVIFAAASLWVVRPLDRVQAQERELDVLTQELSAIVRWSREAIFGIDAHGIITSWNEAAEALYDRPAGEMVGRPLSGILDEEDDETGMLPAHLDEFEVGLFRHTRPDGTQIEIEMTFSPLRDESGAVRGSSIIARDVTQRRRLERDQIAARAAAERANLAKSEFLSRMSHELRTPLNAILGFGQLLELDDLDEEQRENVSYILKAGQHLLALIDEVLQVSRIEAGTLTLSPEPVGMEQAVQDVIGMVAPLAAARDITITPDMASVAGCHVKADHQRLKQVLLNLLSNAVKYNRDGGAITIRGESLAERVRVHITDTGIGIPEKHLPRLFMPFERLGAEEGPQEGTGLGLALSQRLVELMEGTLEVRTAVGEGSTFTIELPAAATTGSAANESAPTETAQAAAVFTRRFRILYVEDNISNFRLIERVLARRPEIELLPAMQGSLGLELAFQHVPDLVLLDLHLPDVPGEEVLHRLKGDPKTAAIPVVILSADATPGRVKRLAEAGATAYLTKPLDVRDLMRQIDEIFQQSDPEIVA